MPDRGTWVDTHGHLFLLDEDPAAVLERAHDAGVEWIMCPGVDVATATASEELHERFGDTVLWSVGLHPHDAERWEDQRADIEALAARSHAIGECGLDYYRNLAPKDAQLQAFRDQVALAGQLSKPLIIHCRDAFADVYEVLSGADLGERALLHCWTGGRKWTKRFAELGVSFSFAGPLTFETGETLRIAAKHVPRDRTVVETDSPYLTPAPHRGEPNEPAFVRHTGETLAAIWGVDPDEVARQTSENASRIFNRA